jgi:hypothetical protein
MHKAAGKAGLNLDEYNEIKRQIAEIDMDLRRLRDPLYKNMPAVPPTSPTYSRTEIESAKKLKAMLTDNALLGRKSGSLEKITNLLEAATKRLKK